MRNIIWTIPIILPLVATSRDFLFPNEFRELLMGLRDRINFPVEDKNPPTAWSFYLEGDRNTGGFQVMEPTRPPNVSLVHNQSPINSHASAGPVIPLGDLLPHRFRQHIMQVISRGITKFALDLDKEIDDSTSVSNIIFSPVSITANLANLLLAACRQTFNEISTILNLKNGIIDGHSEVVHQIFGEMLMTNIFGTNSASKANLATGLFVQKNYPIRKELKSSIEEIYKGDVKNVDFYNGHEAQKVINEWVRNKTMGKIHAVLDSPPSHDTMIIITSALTFSGEWANHFIGSSTKRKPFLIEPTGKSVDVDMMFNFGSFPAYEDMKRGVKILGLPYVERKVSMYILMPIVGGATALKQLKTQLTSEIIEELISKMTLNECIIGLPKMKFNHRLSLRNALENMGLKSLFDSGMSDLSLLPAPNSRRPVDPRRFRNATLKSIMRPMGKSDRKTRKNRGIEEELIEFLHDNNLSSFGLDKLRNDGRIRNPGIFADDVIHKVEVAVSERGTEASAATSISLSKSGDNKKFIVNRPFIFFIRDNHAKLISFWGTVYTPEPHYT